MKINDLEVSGFGVWRELKLSGLDDGLTVFYGANESGKTTLMQFVRAVLYGFSPARRARYLPPVHGGTPGGTLRVHNTLKRWIIDRQDLDREATPLGHVTLHDEQGAAGDEQRLRELLGGVDETTYANIFAVGLHELEELRTLSDTDAADMLYKLSTGLDRVSLVDVVRELGASRNRLLATDGRPSQITQLLSQRERLETEIDELRAAADRYAELSADQHDFDDSASKLQGEVRHHQREARLVETAVGLRDKWTLRQRYARQLADLGDVPNLRPQALEDLDQLNTRISRRRSRLEKLRSRHRRARRLAAALQVNEALERQAPRIAAAAEQLHWIGALETQVQSLRDEVAQLEKLNVPKAEIEQPKPLAAASFKTPPRQALAQLKPFSGALRKAKQSLQEAHEQHRAAEASTQKLAAAPKPLPIIKPSANSIEAAGELVTKLRKRIQLEEKLDKLALHETEIADQGRQHLEHRVLSGQWMLALAFPFVGGTTTAFASLFLGSDLFGGSWLWTLGGGISALAAVAGKSVLERNAALRYEESREQLEAAENQAARARAERDRLDAALPPGGGPLAVRLRTAQQELASLQGVATATEERQAVQEEAVVSREQLDEAIESYRRARKRWREKLAQLGLPPNTQLRVLREQAEAERVTLHETPRETTDAAKQLEAKRAELSHRKRELESVEERLRQLVTETGIDVPWERPAEQIRQLRAELAKQDELRKRRDQLATRRRRLNLRFTKERRRLRRSLRARRRLLRMAGVHREDELRQLVATHSRSSELRRDAEALERDVLAAIGGVCTLAEAGEWLDAEPAIDLEARWDATTAKLQAAERQLQDLYERRGRRGEQISALLADRRLPARVFELGLVNEQLRQAWERWQVVSLAGQTLEQVRRVFERDHQPIVLREASEHLSRLTRGRYLRIWAPLDRPVLRIDSVDGDTIDVEKLSRGTREQIFLALRLALVAAYARRGIRLPMVLDDVLVNFDQDRADAAAEVLRDFAAEGHQLLVFTCHEHIFKLFKTLKVTTQVLPGHVESVVEVPVAPPSPPRRMPRPRAPRKTAPIVALPAPLPELPVSELPPPVEAPPVQFVEEVHPTPAEIAAMLEAVEAVVEPAPALEEWTETVLPIVDLIPSPIEISLPPSPPRPRRPRTIVDENNRFTWEDPVDLKPFTAYLRDDDGDAA